MGGVVRGGRRGLLDGGLGHRAARRTAAHVRPGGVQRRRHPRPAPSRRAALYERLVANYDGVPGLAFENAAVGTVDGSSTLYWIDPRPGDPYWLEQTASFDRATLESHGDMIAGVEDRILESSVASLTLPTLVARHRLTSIDLLHVDVEGYDFEVLRQIDFSSSWAPTFIIYEREHFDRRTDRSARRMLRNAGYHLVDIWPDQFAFRSGPGDAVRHEAAAASVAERRSGSHGG